MKRETIRTTLAAGSETASVVPTDVAWRQYPQIDAAVQAPKPPVVAALERTQAALSRLLSSGNERERERAQVVQPAYGRALSLYQELLDLRPDALDTPSNKGGNPSITK
jgi:hypothetical protein